MKQFPQISEAEYEVMKVIWDNAPISTTEVIQQLSNTSDWNPKTIQTLLQRLLKKGAISYEKKSRVFVYSPVIEKNEYLKQESNSFLNRYFKGTANSMILNLIDNEMLSENELEELRHLLNRRDKKGGN